MAYLQSHRGDYLAGHQGGIGLLGALGGSLLKKGLGWVGRKLAGTPTRKAFTTGVGMGMTVPETIPLPGPYQFKPRAFLPGGEAAISRVSPAPGAVPGDLPPKGYRLNKTGYWLKSGQYVAPGTRYVKIRRRNFANGRALNRAISRTAGFNRMVQRSRKELRKLSRI